MSKLYIWSEYICIFFLKFNPISPPPNKHKNISIIFWCYWIDFNRSYYKCTNPRCGAKKQVERSSDEPNTFIITYEGLHLHFAYPFITLDPPQSLNQPNKKPKVTDSKAHNYESENTSEVDESPALVNPCSIVDLEQGLGFGEMGSQGLGLDRMGSQGLLEDMVPLMVRNPSINKPTNSYSSSCSYSSPPTSPSFSWSNN